MPVTDRLQSFFGTGRDPDSCHCELTFEDETLVVDSTECPFNGSLETHESCRSTVIEELKTRDVERVLTESEGRERAYDDEAAAVLVAAGRFAESVEFHDERLAATACQDPLAAAREATGRADVVSDIAAETGLAELAARATDYESALGPSVGPTLSHWRVETTPPSGTLRDVRDVDSGATVKQYDQSTGPARYYLYPPETALESQALATLSTAYERLASGAFDGGDRAPARAVRAVVEDESDDEFAWTESVIRILRKHARGYGLLEDLFADPSLSDAFVTAPAAENKLRVTVDGETMVTNITLTTDGVEALSSRFRRTSGRAFSRADPTLDATADVASRRLRIAGVTDPPSDGAAFAFRAQDRTVWTLPALVGNGTIPPDAGAALSVAIERGGAVLVAGPRGAGKTTMLGALLWELPPDIRTVVIEDTPELPISQLQESGRDVQALLASDNTAELSPSEALRTALRLGDGALVVGEVRGEEASVLYEAMRVGANSEAVLGTIHGDGGEAVYERVVEDLGVPASSFSVTDIVVTLESTATGDRRVNAIEEVVTTDDGIVFETLFRRTAEGLTSTGRIERGNSQAINGLRSPEESYADIRKRLTKRERLLHALATQDRTSGRDVTDSHTDR
jgi:type IV secretory pathway ATPase VirB11/archaellum biosynthesis ATPase